MGIGRSELDKWIDADLKGDRLGGSGMGVGDELGDELVVLGLEV